MTVRISPRLAREAREAAGLDQDELAVLLGLPASTVASWERGDASPGTDLLPAYARLLGIEVREMFVGDPLSSPLNPDLPDSHSPPAKLPRLTSGPILTPGNRQGQRRRVESVRGGYSPR